MSEELIKIGNRFLLGKQLGAGSFGDIHLGINIQSGVEVAIKLEPINCRHPQLLYESRLIRLLDGKPGIPKVIWYGRQGLYNVMVINLLGPSLEDLFNYCNRVFTIKTSVMILDQLITRIEYLHSRNYVHRDIKPDNFLIGLGEESTVIYMIDYGLCKRYRDPNTQEHMYYRTDKNMIGTARYASVNAHLGIEQARRDDIEGILYLALYFMKNPLPWQGLSGTRQQKYNKILEIKCKVSIKDLCAGLPHQIFHMLQYTRKIKFDEKPDYDYYRKCLKEIFLINQYQYNYLFDWLNKDCVNIYIYIYNSRSIERIDIYHMKN